jgi:putative modified peptide
MNTMTIDTTIATRNLADDAGFTFEPKRWPLSIDQMRCLFERLSEDDAYRALFVSDIHAAFAQLPGAPTVPVAMTPGTCFRPNNLASKDALRSARDRVVTMALTRSPFIPKMLEV